jgi:Zn-dependent M28 family amino/carboxypeptidase
VWDNGTGIASIIEIARVLGSEPLERSVRVIAFAVEEVGLWGSTAYTVQHADELGAVAGMVNLDAVASAFPAKQSIWTDEAMEPFAIESAARQGWEVEEVADARAFEFSDNNPFTDAGVPACWIWEFPPIHPYYHSTGDTRARVAPAKVAATAAVSAQIARRLALDPSIDLGRARRRGEVPVAGSAA